MHLRATIRTVLAERVPLCPCKALRKKWLCTGLSKTLAIQSNVSRSGAMGELDCRGEPLNSERCAPGRVSAQTGVLISWFPQQAQSKSPCCVHRAARP